MIKNTVTQNTYLGTSRLDRCSSLTNRTRLPFSDPFTSFTTFFGLTTSSVRTPLAGTPTLDSLLPMTVLRKKLNSTPTIGPRISTGIFSGLECDQSGLLVNVEKDETFLRKTFWKGRLLIISAFENKDIFDIS